MAICLSIFCGYGILFIVFDYRKSNKSIFHAIHVSFGIGYIALIFCIVNPSLINPTITINQISERIPFTLLISFLITFILIFLGSIWRQFFYIPKEI